MGVPPGQAWKRPLARLARLGAAPGALDVYPEDLTALSLIQIISKASFVYHRRVEPSHTDASTVHSTSTSIDLK